MNKPVQRLRKIIPFNLNIWLLLSANIRGMGLMAVFAGVVSSSHVLARDLSGDIHPVQVAFFRTIVPLIILTPILMRQGRGW